MDMQQQDRAAHALRDVHHAASDLRTVIGEEHDLQTLQAILTEARAELNAFEAAVSALGWKVVFLESEFGQTYVKGK